MATQLSAAHGLSRRYSGAVLALAATLAGAACETVTDPSGGLNATGMISEQALAGLYRMSFTDFDVFTMTSDGKNITNITNSSSFEIGAGWSPNGTKIAFTSKQNLQGYFDVWIMNPNGSTKVNLTFKANVDQYFNSFSPNGSKILYTQAPPNTHTVAGEIWVMNADGSSPTRLTSGRSDNGASWSPNGTKIAFSRRHGTSPNFWQEIWVMNANGTNQVRLTTGSGFFSVGPRWSPNGAKIAFTRTPVGGSTQSDVYVMNANGSNITRLTNNPWPEIGAAWSPDGTQIAYSHGSGAPSFGIYVMNSNGSNVTKLTNGPHSTPDWGPAVP